MTDTIEAIDSKIRTANLAIEAVKMLDTTRPPLALEIIAVIVRYIDQDQPREFEEPVMALINAVLETELAK